MRVNRRHFLTSAAAAALVPGVPRAETQQVLEAKPSLQQIAPPGYDPTPIWSFDGTAPGSEIRVMQGGRLKRRLANTLPQATSVHWHGVRIDNAMDGVPGMTQDAVEPGAIFDYDFIAPDAGTFWYHSHNRSMEQVARGLYGPLIVEEATPPDFDRDLVLMLDDWRLDPQTAAIAEDFAGRHDPSHAGRMGNLTTVNGVFDPKFEVGRNERLRLRVINAATDRVFDLGLTGLDGWVVALDGMPLAEPLKITGAFPLAPAQRADLCVDVTAEPGETANLVSLERDGGYGLAGFTVAGRAGTARRGTPAPLPPNPLPDLSGLPDAPLHEMRLQGGAMRWLESATLGNTRLSGRELADLGKFWALNGRADRPDDPFLDAERGSLHRISFVNETAFAHAMHLHGHHFRVITPEGRLGPWRDTVLVDRGETRQVALVADNPGKWLLHCHMLSHSNAGMMSWFRVA